MWLLYVTFVAASCGRLIAFPQNDQLSMGMAQSQTEVSSFNVDGFIFDGPADRPSSDGATSSSARGSTASLTSTTTASTMDDARRDACVTTCPTTPEYNPVCGSDNVNYENPGRLNCMATCGKDVTLRHYGRCTTTKIRGG